MMNAGLRHGLTGLIFQALSLADWPIASPAPLMHLMRCRFFFSFFFFCSRDLYPEPCVVKRLKTGKCGPE